MKKAAADAAAFLSLAAVVVLFVLAVLVLVVVLIGLILVVVLILIAVLVIHVYFLRKSLFLRQCRDGILPRNSGFILSFKQNRCDQACNNRCGDSAGGGFQSAGEDAEETVLIDRLPDTLGNIMAKTG